MVGARTVFEMEASHPEVVADMLAFSTAMFPIGVDGKMMSARSGKVYWDPADAARGDY
jgi:hypothetical protein